MAPTASMVPKSTAAGEGRMVASTPGGALAAAASNANSGSNTTNGTFAPEQHYAGRQLRISLGQCPDCGIQTHNLERNTRRLIPLTDEHVLKGRCLLCHPLPSAKPAAGVVAADAAAAPQPDSLAQAPAPPTKRIKMEPVDEDVETDDEALNQYSGAPFEAAAQREAQIQQSDNRAKALAPDRDSHVTPSPPPGEAAISRGLQAIVQPSTAGSLLALPAPADDSDAPAKQPTNASPQKQSKQSKRFRDKGVWGTYVGELNAEGRRHGKGKMTWDDGEVYDGLWKNDMFDGKGKMSWDEGEEYDGEWKNNKKEGKGTYQYANGNKYVGGFKDGLRNGRGTWYWDDGEVDIDVYKDDKPFGEGVRWSKDRETAWLLLDGAKERKISLKKAKEMASQLGFDGVPPAMDE